MNTVTLGKGNVTVRLEFDEVVAAVAALNEVCNGVHISDAEFATRLGLSRDEAREVLKHFHSVLTQLKTSGAG